LTVTALAAHLKLTRANLSRIINGKTGVSAEMALRLSEAFELLPRWVRMQANYDLAKLCASGVSRLRDWPRELLVCRLSITAGESTTKCGRTFSNRSLPPSRRVRVRGSASRS